ncbi:hypothetical protein TNCV_3201381 [Trichonephila clavipes]|nr:hypothetical protein TNCV_3201381 [Trichonephila clavipes]
MYFDEYKKEFYSQGGWSQLKSVSISYSPAREFLRMNFPEGQTDGQLCLLNIIKAVNNYKTFSDRVHANCKTVTKKWVKFRLQNFDRSDTSCIITNMIKDPKVMKMVSLQLKRLCDPNRSGELNIKIQSEYRDTEKIPHSSLKIKCTLSDITEVIQREIELSYQESNDRTDEVIAKNLSQKNRDTTSSDDNASRNNSFLKLKRTSRDDLSRIKTQGAREQKLNEENKKERDLERGRPEMRRILRMILVLGNPSGIIHVQSSLPRSDTSKYKHSKKK